MLETGRGSLPFALVHGEPLVAAAAWATGEAGIQLVDLGTEWPYLVDAGVPFVLHDPLCPLTPPAFLAACVAHAAGRSVVTAGVRPVTDTVKALHDDRVGATHDRADLLQVVSPVVLPATVVAALDGLPTTELAALVAVLAERFPVETLEAPAEARRVADESDLRVLEALTAPG
ncbi:2-C-methyl-D-erythritol 4-phosphate cytidylyltransferase [Nocardioides halotolerans]|uniref:2-C-methyl-D-erythritol 4-phosphate cytidylyltransferase n=1 Tax=Nocardioides halotolerans TaxID=433660 RepID=UPI0003FFAEAC|nr:2-C-methyl-D-erythritol 4-phosphate cytidylyltransferase [Nocardioides halotolerans]